MHSAGTVIRALLLTMLGATGTAIGGLLIILNPKAPSKRFLGLVQGLAAGLMLSISFLDLMPHAVTAIGFPVANVCFFAGAMFFALVVRLVPEPSPHAMLGYSNIEDAKSPKVGERLNIPLSLMIKLDPKKVDPAVGGRQNSHSAATQKVMASGIITAMGIALHNFPEGIAVFLASVKGGSLGLSLAVAIALHNIPEGIAVALPVFFATRSRWQALKLTILSGLAEPAAVIVVGLIFPVDLNEYIVEGMLAAVGGIMAFLTFHELAPLAIEHTGRSDATNVIFFGMALMSVSLYWLDAVSA
mmetsp:Transcript_26656/g.58021  ORF Transcript_26656/g.58021 Transcript_26656/m.58021 type:complete len:301 (+) Transcript_26656:63-965(+)